MRKKHWLKIFLAVVFACIVFAGLILVKKKEEKDFNIILISIDTLRADHLGCYKYERNTSPAIDEFRKDAVLFRRCMVQSTSTLASHASMFTSLIPSHHGAYFTRSQPLPNNLQTMAEFLHQKNYRTISFNDGGQIAAKFGMDQGFEIYESLPFKKPAEMVFQRIVNKAVEWIDGHLHPGEKFFLFLHTYETHHPYTPEKKYLERFESGYNGNLPRHISVELIKQINKGEVTINEEDKKHIINTYDAEIRAMDDSFARFMTFLKEKRLYDNTLIIFTSDHGEEFGEHGIWATHAHGLFNEQLHVPLIMKLPASGFASRKVNHLVRSIDILPTVMDLLDENIPGDFEGISLLPLIKGVKSDVNIFTISQRDMQKTYPRKYWSIIKGKWKLYDKKLYNLINDPGELQDVADSNKKVKAQLESLAIRFLKRKKGQQATNRVKLDDKTKKKLKTLGYVH
ncbi:MAG: sulfatase-like hydrolase/transferase [Candidatus Aminicenantes bacterium]|nr:sulfatase-like hydrolase/transferase [Candidatus Aminicenantes bacterium]NIM81824.1 sulfatase-like hydrolase/transferase [Candidatus Aminicenantes bacterium]NIN21197.1 sulfatase-like hydrolase/transferase [Candidatus Aminicenantes bacterium]NIN45021.1 sulfatase-like hydrolase/transferase [Candidatus Aminicenantes bacterium]NIR08669.1 sulfatase-like hydrolase/transferase [Candidatus Aminicenantes bacterium]